MVTRGIGVTLALLAATLSCGEGAPGVLPPTPGSSPTHDRSVLRAFYDTTGGPRWRSSQNWLSGEPLSTWFGVSTDAEGHVVALSLPMNRLVGDLPAELSRLVRLKVLNLQDNDSLGGLIPTTFGELVNLESLLLYDTGIRGPIPHELGKLVELKVLRLDDTFVEGSIPQELGNLRNLDTLNLVNALIGGPIPTELGNLVNLKSLSLGTTADRIPPWPFPERIRGLWPVVDELAQLEILVVGRGLLGVIPVDIGDAVELSVLSLVDAQLIGALPEELWKLRNLRQLSVSKNERLGGPLSLDATSLTNLRTLHIDGTDLCVPEGGAFDAWVANIRDFSGNRCED